MDDKPSLLAKSTKNNDCYFYYYSSCSKGDACPFRHEPAALRNETVCIFWLQGHCNKANCIFRHMELTKKRDKIACWFETQPGGCKKPHCPFQHQNILDHPREEDIKKKPDLILPVRKDEASKDDADVIPNEETERQILLPRNEGGSLTPPVLAPYGAIPRNPIIVPLQDGESDSESVSGSPYKRVNPELSAQLEWELRKLRQIQADEADIIGYVFADEEDGEEEEDGVERYADRTSMPQNQDVEEYVVEEILEVEEEPDAAHRRLHPPPSQRNTLLGAQVRSYPEPIHRDYRKALLKPSHFDDLKGRRKVQISQRLGGVASRALAETLGTDVHIRKPTVRRLTNRMEDQGGSVSAKTIAERLSQSPGKKLSLKDRLGTRHSKGHTNPRAVRHLEEEEEEKEEVVGVVDRSIASQIIAIRNQQDTSDADDHVPDSSSKALAPQSRIGKEKGETLDFTVKSLADIRAERQRKVTVKKKDFNRDAVKGKPQRDIKNGTKLHVNTRRVVEAPSAGGRGDGLKILSLSEIKAKQTSVSRSNLNLTLQKKRSISPISFDRKDKSKSISNISSSLVQNKKRSISPVSFESEYKQTSMPKNSAGLVQQKRSPPPISLQKDIAGYKKIRLSPHSRESVQTVLGTETNEQKTPNLGTRKITINRSPVKKSNAEPSLDSQPIESREKRKPITSVAGNLKKTVSVNNNKNNNNVPLSHKKTVDGVLTKQPLEAVKDSKETPSESSLSRLDSMLDEEEELLLGGEMLDDEEDIDEAALLL